MFRKEHISSLFSRRDYIGASLRSASRQRAGAWEYTNVTTMGMVNAQTGAFDEEIIRTLGYMSCFVGANLLLSVLIYLWLRKQGVARFSAL